MKKHFTILQAVLFVLLAASATFVITFQISTDLFNQRLESVSADQAKFAKLTEIQEYIDKYYVGKTDKDTLLDGMSAGLVAGTEDEWSYYMTAEQYKLYLENSAGEFGGIGVTVEYDSDYDALRVLEVYTGAPAEKVGILAGDILSAADGKTLADLGYNGFISSVRGEVGTPIKLTIVRGTADPFDVTVIRQIVHPVTIEGRLLTGGVGYVRIKEFGADGDKEFITMIENLRKQGAKSLVFDLRSNPGGQLATLLPMLDYLLPEGVLFIEKDKAGNKNEYTSDANALDMPSVCLVNEYSYSAAEFFAACLNETSNIPVVGLPTTGKGYAQTPIELSDGSALVLSTLSYFTPKGVSLAETKGIVPTYRVDLPDDKYKSIGKMSAAEDPQLLAAMDVLAGKTPAAAVKP